MNVERRARVRRVVALLLAAQLVLAVILIGVTRSQASALPAAPDPHSFDFAVPDAALTIMTGAERGQQVADRWATNATLVFGSMQVDWSPDPPPPTVTSVSPFGWIRLVYVAPVANASSDFAALSLLFERVSGSLVDASVSPWHLEPGVDSLLAGIQVPEENALLAAEIGGGTAYRAACPDQRHQSVVSVVIDRATRQPIWHIGYEQSGSDASRSMTFTVNASTGALATVRQAPPSCA